MNTKLLQRLVDRTLRSHGLTRLTETDNAQRGNPYCTIEVTYDSAVVQYQGYRSHTERLTIKLTDGDGPKYATCACWSGDQEANYYEILQCLDAVEEELVINKLM